MLSSVLVFVSFLVGVSSLAGEPSGAAPTLPAATEKSASEHAWDDLRWLTTAFEAYASDNEWLYAPADGRRDGDLSEFDELLEWYYANTYPKRRAPPRVDPRGQPYRFVISDTRMQYAFYSLGPAEKVGDEEESFLENLKGDRLSEGDFEGSSPLIQLATNSNHVSRADVLEFCEQSRDVRLQILKPVETAEHHHGNSEGTEILLKLETPIGGNEHSESPVNCGA